MKLLYDGEVTGKEISVRDAAIRESISQALEKYNVKKVITYHSTIEKAENFAYLVLKDAIRGYEILHINSDMTGKQRREVMERFRNAELAIITNARSRCAYNPGKRQYFYRQANEQPLGRTLRRTAAFQTRTRSY
jgi:hypothetical protein